MVFSSLTFLCVFLPIVFGLYCVVPNIRAKNGLLIAASLLFYAYGEPVYVLLMLASTILNYACGRLVASAIGSKRKLCLVVAVVGNLAVLGVFKYAGMLVATIDTLFSVNLLVPQITLPIGISFFTFQAMSYVIDVYRGDVAGEKNYFNVLLYISFFPQLIAGPIIKYHDIAEQLKNRKQDATQMALGLRRFCVGLAKKVLIANVMAQAADALFTTPVAELNILSAWIAAIAYMLQIYFDFSGYSDMAIGLGHMFGFAFKENFNYPYKSKNIKEFWKRWHISLSTWFKEYLYIPLGGNRKGKARTIVNKFTVFFLCGLWHGASWTFVVWGLFHGFFLFLEEVLPIHRLPKCLGHLYALLVVCVGFVIFRADTLSQAGGIIAQMFTGFQFDAAQMSVVCEQLTPLFIVTLLAACIAALPVKGFLLAHISQGNSRFLTLARPVAFVASAALLALCVLSLSGGGYNPFIYFRF